jgi:mono/diheme cytochrome c family protein
MQAEQGLSGQPAAVAFDSGSHWVVQTREPAGLLLENGTQIKLAADSVADTGQALFHLDAGLGMACASCHPEGDEDGHTWHFAAGLRRTQPLPGGVLARTPFHWTGELAGMSDLVSEVMVKRMGLGVTPDSEHVAALGAFLDRIPARPVEDTIDPDKAARGKAVFEDETVGCAGCHVGRQLTDNLSHDVGTGGPFVTPTLIGVGFRTPLFHDGCATTLAGRFGICGGGDRHGKTSALSADQATDLVEYLKTL